MEKTVMMLASFAIGSVCLAGPNLIVNGDFEEGNTGFTTEYGYSPGDLLLGDRYAVDTDPSNVHPAPPSYGDHTSGTGYMMIVNGSPHRHVVWEQSVSVTPNTDYILSYWVSSWCATLPAKIESSINGHPIGTGDAPAVMGQWVEVSHPWSSGTSWTATISLVDLETAWAGNDFAIDDIALVTIPPPTVEAIVDIDPDTLNLNSRGKWITAYIALPEGYDVQEIDVETVSLKKDDFEVGGEYGEFQTGILMVKFRRSEVQSILEAAEEVELTVTGDLVDGGRFEGTDIIRVVDKGGKTE